MFKAKYVFITFLTTGNAGSICDVVTRMTTKQRTQQLSILKGDLRSRLTKLQSKFAKLKCFSGKDDSISEIFSFFLVKKLLIIRFWVTNGAYIANGIFQTFNYSNPISRYKMVYLFQKLSLSVGYYFLCSNFSPIGIKTEMV